MNDESVITREVAVSRIRCQLIAIQEEGKSMCRIAAERNILCRGFHRDSDEEMRQRYTDRIDDVGELPRGDLEEQANAWQIERQKREKALLSCDVQYMVYESCRGWDDFSNEELSQFCLELAGEQVRVIGKKELTVI